MTLSKKNLDKLNTFIKNNNENNDNYIFNKNMIEKSDKKSNIPPKLEDPSKIFYSLIDNSETLNETSEVNHLLRESERDFIIKSRETDYSRHLTTEEELYDEFNYLLEE